MRPAELSRRVRAMVGRRVSALVSSGPAETYRRVRAAVGRRGAALLFFGLLDLVIAADMASARASVSGAYAFLASALPLRVWAIPWAVVGLLCLAYAPRPRDRPAFVAASALKGGWSMIYVAGWLCGEIPRGYVAGAIWLAFAAFVQVIAGWREEPRRDT